MYSTVAATSSYATMAVNALITSWIMSSVFILNSLLTGLAFYLVRRYKMRIQMKAADVRRVVNNFLKSTDENTR